MQFYRLGSSSRLGSPVDQLDSQLGLQWCDLRLDLVGAQLGLLAAGPVLHDPGLLVGTRMDFALPGRGMDLQRRRKGRTHAQPPLPVALADSTAFDTGKVVRPQRKHVPVQPSVEVVRARIRLAATFRVRGFADGSERRRPRLTQITTDGLLRPLVGLLLPDSILEAAPGGPPRSSARAPPLGRRRRP